MQPYFRDAVRDDIPAIATILGGTTHLRATDGPEHVGRYRDALTEIDRTDGNYLLVAEYDNQIGAVVQMITYRQLHDRGARSAEVVALHVAEAFATSGIGAMLVDHAIERARDIGCQRISASISTARTDEHVFWERHGFVQLERGYTRPLT